MKDDFKVENIPSTETYEWLLKKHYAHRLPMAIEYSYGLYDNNNILQGVCVFGPTAPPVPITLFGERDICKVRELTRLVVNGGLGKNVLSYFVSSCLKLLPSPMCIISFADKGNGHHGYIYQATNFKYTGEGGQKFNFVDKHNKEIHSLTINDKAALEGLNQSDYIKKYGIKKIKASPKYRYVIAIGNKHEKRDIYNKLILGLLPYPKGENQRYDASYKPKTQLVMF